MIIACPYCNTTKTVDTEKIFTSFEDVKWHVAHCKLSTKEYVICNFYGSIKIDKINSYDSLAHFRKDFPKTSIKSYTWAYLRKTKTVDLKRLEYNKEIIIELIQNYVKNHNRIPSQEDFNLTDLKYPAANTVKRYFKTWNAAIIAAGFEPNINTGFGNETRASDGISYRSQVEAYFVDHFLFEKEEYEYEKPYGNGWLFDFYLPKHNLYIEIDGNINENYRTKINNKIKYCKDNNLKLLVIPYLNVYKKDFRLVI